jgi:hypothetical protein
MNPDHLDPDSSDRSVTADILLRQEPDEDEEEEDDRKKERNRRRLLGVSAEHVSISHRQYDGRKEKNLSYQCASGSPLIAMTDTALVNPPIWA